MELSFLEASTKKNLWPSHFRRDRPYFIWCKLVEVYNDNLYDLLDGSRQALQNNEGVALVILIGRMTGLVKHLVAMVRPWSMIHGPWIFFMCFEHLIMKSTLNKQICTILIRGFTIWFFYCQFIAISSNTSWTWNCSPSPRLSFCLATKTLPASSLALQRETRGATGSHSKAGAGTLRDLILVRFYKFNGDIAWEHQFLLLQMSFCPLGWLDRQAVQFFGHKKFSTPKSRHEPKLSTSHCDSSPKLEHLGKGWFVGGVRGMAFLLRLGKIIKSSQLNNFESFQGTDCNGSPVEKRCEHQKLLGQWHRV